MGGREEGGCERVRGGKNREGRIITENGRSGR